LGWLSEGDRWYLSLPLAHIGGFALLLRCLLGHQTVVIGQAKSSEPERVLSELGTQNVTLASLVPTQLARLLARWPSQGLPHLRAVLVGGAPATSALRDQARSYGVRTLTTYGLTEMSSQVATERFHAPSPGNLPEGAVGPALPGVDVKADESGRLRVRGPMAMRGYLNFEDPFDRDGYIVTQDLGRVDDSGNVYIFGRVDNVIITGGENVAAEFVESALLGAPGVREVCVVGVPDADWGAKVVAAVVLEPSSLVTMDDLHREVARSLPGFACPKQIRIVPHLPHLPSGKVDRPQVRTWFGP
jgi:o-succinylbenzoate---CoA ligase